MDHNSNSQPDKHNEVRNEPQFDLNNARSNSPDLKEQENIKLSQYTQALIKSWKTDPQKKLTSPTKISVSQTVSFAAFLYEKMRNAVEFREEHLIRRATIERILKRRVILNENGREISEPLIKELLWARYYENNTIGEEKIVEIQAIIDKYFFLRNELASGRSKKEQERIARFIIDCLSCEIEENLSPNHKREAFINYVYQILHHHIAPFNDGEEMEKDIQVYIAVEKTFAHSDQPLITYHLLKLMLPEITKTSWKNADQILAKLYDVYQSIERALAHEFSDKIRNIVRKFMPPYLILRDIFKQNPQAIDAILKNEDKLKVKVDEVCRKRYDESRSRLRRTGVRSFIYILLTKVIFALLIEIPYDYYIMQGIATTPILINVAFPPLLMAFIIVTVSIPGDDNTRRIFQLIKEIITSDPDSIDIKTALSFGKKPRNRSVIFKTIFSLIYLLTYLISFGTIIYILTKLNFNPVSQAIFIFFITLVTFFAYKVIQITQEFQVVDKEGFFSSLFDFFFIPIIKVGQWISGEVLTKFNFFIFIFDFIIEMPFKAIVEIIDEWIHFVRLKKEEMV